ncbi:glycerate kinase family protein [Portibacter marinus]|uniref:glycerate kinase family protein n=1 Tax=Portibacter marinus TaxID=2898660 RepID=UPI001F2FED61|nr:glycerate kinase [Portibacter marinus]
MARYNKFLIVPDSFKNSLSAEEVSQYLAEGLDYFKDKLEVKEFPFADGGEGSLKVIERFIDLERRTIFTFDAFLKPIRASYLLDSKNKTAYLESAAVIGLEIIDKEPDCYNASSFGIGTMIADALDMGVETLYLFLGGTATCDGGVGMAAALGYQFITEKRIIERPLARDVKYISEYSKDNIHPRLDQCQFKIATDVDNTLLGDRGAVFTYASQKGATEEHLELLELGMENIKRFVRENKHVDIQQVIGSGAAGGLGAGSLLFLNGELASAFDMLASISNLKEEIKSADIIITGEGHIDMQSFHGKLIDKIQAEANQYHKPVWLVCAIRSISEKEALKMGYEKIESIYRSMPKEINIPETKRALVKIGKKWAEEWTKR